MSDDEPQDGPQGRRRDLDWLAAYTLARTPMERRLVLWQAREMEKLREPGGIFRNITGV